MTVHLLELDDKELAYLEKTLRMDYDRLAGWLEKGGRRNKMEEVAKRMKTSEGMLLKTIKSKSEGQSA